MVQPVGFEGEFTMITRVRGVIAAAMSASGSAKRPSGRRRYGTVTGTPPAMRTASPRLGQAGEGMIISSPGSSSTCAACMIAFMPPAVTPNRSGGISTPQWRAW